MPSYVLYKELKWIKQHFLLDIKLKASLKENIM